MSKKSAKPAGPVTRRQQVEALRKLKGREIAENVAQNIREAVKSEVESQLKVIKDTMLSLIDRVVDLESTIQADAAEVDAEIQRSLDAARQDAYDRDDRLEREETPPTKVPGGDEVAPGPGGNGDDLSCPNTCQEDASG